MAFHSRFGPATGNHILPKWQFPTEADLLAFANESSGNPSNAGPPVAEEVQGVGWAVAENTLWVLKNHSPVTWEALGDAASALRHTGPAPALLPIAALNPGEFLQRDPLTDEIVSANPPPFSVERTVTVAPSGADATTVKEALDILATLVPPVTFDDPASIEIFTGFYFEPGPFPYVLPDGVHVVGPSPETTLLIPADPSATLFTAAGFAMLESFAVEELFDPGGTGIIADGTLARVRMRDVWFRGVLSPIVIQNGGSCDLADVQLNGFPGDPIVDAIAMSGDSVLLARGVNFQGSGIGPPWKSGLFNDGSVALVTDGFFLNNDRAVFNTGPIGTTRVFASRITNTSLESFRCEDGELNLIGSTISSQEGTLELVQEGGLVVIDSTTMRKDRIVTSGGTSILGLNSLVPGEEEFFNLRNMSVGGALDGQGRSAFFAQGSPTVRTVRVLQNTNGEIGTWTEITSEITTPEGAAVDVFSALTPGASTYIGADYVFWALVGTVVTASDSVNIFGQDFIIEYWNGAAWVDPNYMVAAFDGANDQFGRLLFRETGKGSTRIGNPINWTQRDLDPGTGPINKYWLRVRVVGTTTVMPQVQELKILPTSVRISDDGQLEFFGDARRVGELDWARQSLDPQQGLAPLSGLIPISASITLETKENLFPGTGTAAVCGLVDISLGVDTSKDLELELRVFATGGVGEQFELGIVVALIPEPATYTGANPQLPLVVQLPIVAAFQEIVFTQPINVGILQPGDRLAFQISRFGNTGGDTTTADMILESTTIRVTRWAA